MKKYILLLIIPLLSFGQLGEYYYSKGNPKAKGLNFKIKKPLGFDQMEGNRPNVVQKWTKKSTNYDSMVTFLILVKNLPIEMQNISQEEWRQFFKYEGGVEEFTQAMENTSNEKYFVLDNYGGICYNQEVSIERLEYELKMFTKTAQVLTSKHMFQIQMGCSSEEVLKNNEWLFQSLANSVIMLDQY